MSSTKPRERPKVGVGVFVTNPAYPNCVLLGKRKNSSGSGLYALPGGHLEFGEEWTECGRRETLEETGLVLVDVCYCTVVNAIVEQEDYHYITLFVKGVVDNKSNTEVKNLEPEKCEGWSWVDWDNFPPDDQLFCPLRVVRQEGFNPFTSKCEKRNDNGKP